MNGWLLGACALLSASSLASGGVMLQQGISRVCGVLLTGSGLGVAAGTWLLASEATGGEARVAFVAAGLLLFPAALWAFPRPRWRHPVDFCLTVLLVAPGVIATLGSAGRETGLLVDTPDDPTAVLASVVVLAAVATSLWRLESSAPEERSPLVWSTLALACAGLLGGVLLFLDSQGEVRPLAITIAAMSAVPAAMAIGVVRPQLVDVRGLVVKAAVFIVLAVLYVALFVGVVSVARALGAVELSPAATALLGFALGIAIRPVSALLHAAMDQMLFGDRPDPLGAASRVVGRIGEDPADALKSIREALALPYLALRRGEKTVVESGVPVAHVRTLRLSSSVELDVDLVVGLRPGDLRLPADDTRVLLIVGPLIMQLARSQDLTAEVQASRAQAITAIADERRRLRRDLHDGLGPTLTGIAFATDAARNVARSDPDAVDALLGDIRQDTSDAITQIRALVYGMRPPALDDVGLLAALKQQAATLRRGDGSPLPVSFDVPEQLPPLPAAVEVAAYRIVIEALTNVTRHTTRGTAVVTISLSTPHRLNITVTDDDPHATSWTPGVGIAAMRERAAELDGTLTCGPTVEGGRVSASIPF